LSFKIIYSAFGFFGLATTRSGLQEFGRLKFL